MIFLFTGSCGGMAGRKNFRIGTACGGCNGLCDENEKPCICVKKVVGKGKLKKIFRKYFGGKCVIVISDKRK